MRSERLTRLRRVSPLWWGAGAVGGYSLLFVAYLWIAPWSAIGMLVSSDLLGLGGIGVMLVLFLIVAARRRRSGNRRIGAAAWLLAGGAIAFLLGDTTWSYEEIVVHVPPFPSLADVGYLASYPLLLLGILLLPRGRGTVTVRSRVLLDGFLVLVATATLSWYFVLGPTALEDSSDLVVRSVAVAYPVFDLVLVSCLLLLWSSAHTPAVQRVTVLLSISLVAIVLTDSIFAYQQLHGLYHSGELLDVGWTFGYMLLLVAALGAQDARANNAETELLSLRPGFGRLLLSLFPFVLVPAVAVVFFSVAAQKHAAILGPGVYAGSLGVALLIVVRQVLMVRENQQLYAAALEYADRLRALTTSDPLTELPNLRGMVSALDGEIERTHRYHRPFSILIIDIDHFKALNDGYGHPAGDSVLREASRVMRGTLRGVDVLSRWGGEEFLALLPETDTAEARLAAEHLREAVAVHAFGVAQGIHLTCSVGVATYPQHADERDELVAQADRAMYVAKHLGRNQVRSIDEEAVQVLSSQMDAPESRQEASIVGTVEALAALVTARDRYTGHHADHVAARAAQVALALGLSSSEAHWIGLAGRLHDIGKVAIPDAILMKPGRLSPEEWTLMRTHPIVGAEVVNRIPELRSLARVIRTHHERWDGQGYPDQLAGEEIPLAARILAVVDAYGAMRSDRPSHDARSPSEAVRELQRGAGTQFDPSVVKTFLALLDEGEPRSHLTLLQSDLLVS